MTNKQKFQLCLEQANRIVAAYRDELPVGLDPQNTWAAVAIGGAGLVMGGVSAATAKGPPKPYKPEDLTYSNVQSMARWGMPAYLLNQLYNPAFSSIGNTMAQNTLFGTPEHMIDKTVYVNKGHDWVPMKQQVNVPGTQGLLDIYKNVGKNVAEFNRNQTRRDMMFAPEAMQGYMNASPLMGGLVNRAQQGLDQGGALDASTRRTLEQASLGDASMRGFGHSPLDAFMAYSSMGAEAEARKRQREQFALQTQSMLPDPFALARGSSTALTYGPAIGMQGAQFGRQSATPILNPFAFGGTASAGQADNTTSNILGAISGGLLNMGGGIAGGLAGRRRAQPVDSYGNTMYAGSDF